MTAVDRVVGVIGGMGPDATIDFMVKVLARTPADHDQDHVRMLVDQNPRVPSRQYAMQGSGESPGPMLAHMAARLEVGGADFLVMPCNTAHAWEDEIIAATSIPFVSIIEESVAAAARVADGPIGLLTTPGCFAAGLYQEALERAGCEAVLQSSKELGDAMAFVDHIKAGDQSSPIVTGLRTQGENLVSRGARAVIAACTEIPLVLHQSMFGVPYIASTDLLADRTVSLALCKEPLPLLILKV